MNWYIQKRRDANGNEIEEDELHPQFRHGTRTYNLRILHDQLADRQREQQEAAEALPELIRQHTALLEAGNKAALEAWKNRRGRAVTRAARRAAAHEFRYAQLDLEDFLYYQNSLHRWKRMGVLETENQKENSGAKQAESGLPVPAPPGRGGYKFMWDAEDPMLVSLLDRYDSIRIGTTEHRHGMIDDIDGTAIARPDDDTIPPVRPQHLRLWTPTSRRRPTGVPFRKRPGLDPNVPILDDEAIFQKWREIESRYDKDPKATYKTHAERRRAEREQYQGTHDASSAMFTRPESSNILVKDLPASQDVPARRVIDDRFWRIQTDHGLFISALESSYDWRTSYDLLGPLKSGAQMDFEISEERDTIRSPRPLDDDEAEDDIEFQGEEPRHFERRVVPTTRKAVGKGKKATGKGKQAAAKSSKSASTAGAKRGAEEASDAQNIIDYPYEAREFTGPSKKVKLSTDPQDNLRVSTDWAEETTGRREWHAYMRYSPCSSVDSPPHLPVQPGKIPNDSIPEGFSLTDTKATTIEQGPRQRCNHNPERCRIWWNPDHSPEECWIIYPEQPTRPADPSKWPIQDVDGPKDSGDDHVTVNGTGIYHSRLYDHYGLVHNLGPQMKEPRWPNIGVRVPYEPMTLDDLRLKEPSADEDIPNAGIEDTIASGCERRPIADEPARAPVGDEDTERVAISKTDKILAKDAEFRAVHEIPSLAVPIIENTQRPWGWSLDRDLAEDFEGVSDDEDDLFTKAYKKGSRPTNPMAIPLRSNEPEGTNPS
ncbi:uncharacterized protein K460DRAFT_405261 [Cucurbitaria berberidis CBS 394.84]|uniref:Uncharacterized protein n=1 Tax=Cucurbitaria berberidis CBS 394.84 TaxID=1168544 RepID=A0A9P4GGE2_9PLEO|nr:uncharacterized protein K460DRAFT_405261 [Cucurbitaria berberidis CBS 394.84]KAF1844981.1 hypothetical protein K460DRAFT_405261 [Cucurbitaria berberidis CBS 394.84]